MSASSIADIADRLREALRGEQASVHVSDSEIVRISSSSNDMDRVLEVRRRDVADIEVAFVVPNRQGSPFEQLFVGPVSEEPSVIQEAVDFVSGIVSEQVVLVWDSIPLRGGRRFLEAQELDSGERHKYAWGVSWAGGLDWERGA